MSKFEKMLDVAEALAVGAGLALRQGARQVGRLEKAAVSDYRLVADVMIAAAAFVRVYPAEVSNMAGAYADIEAGVVSYLVTNWGETTNGELVDAEFFFQAWEDEHGRYVDIWFEEDGPDA